MQKEEVLVDKCPTGIAGFDKATQGGFVRNSVNLVLGGPGSGKSTLLLQFLWNGVNSYNENGLYVSFENDVVEIFKDGANFGWDFAKLDSTDRCKFLKVSPEITTSELEKELQKIVARYDIKRICFDPINIFALGIEDVGKVRQQIFELSSMLKRMKTTVLLSDELPDEIISASKLRENSETFEFMADSVTALHSSGLGGAADRAVRVIKMRRTDHERAPVPMEITDSGISVLAK